MKLSQKNLLLLRQGQNLNRNGLKRPKEESKGHPRPAKSAIPKTLPQNGQMNLLPPMNDKLPPLVLQHTAVFPTTEYGIINIMFQKRGGSFPA